MRILIDTNIFIYREDDKELPVNLQNMLSTITKLGAQLLIHPSSLEDIKQDKNIIRRNIMLSKVKVYPLLKNPPNPDSDAIFLSSVISNSKGGKVTIDDRILYSVYRNAVDFLITEDKGIHTKAKAINTGHRVFNIDDAASFLNQLIIKDEIQKPPALREDQVYNLNIDDPFFNPIKEDYPEFTDWFKKISREGRKCWVHYDTSSNIDALLVYKIENESIISKPPLPKRRRIKLCLLKVDFMGYKIGELFIKLVVNLAIINKIQEVYLSCFPKNEEHLFELINEYGFKQVSINARGENIYIKRLIPDKIEQISSLYLAKKYYPCYCDGKSIKKFIVPIKPQYHSKLFTDFQGRQITLFEQAGEFIIEGNTIKKAYICHSKIKSIRPGDIICFYLSGRKMVTSIGIIEQVQTNLQNLDYILLLVAKRTVYSKKELEYLVEKPCTVILFIHSWHLANTISLKILQEKKMLKTAPRSIISISEKCYSFIKNKGGIDERFIIN